MARRSYYIRIIPPQVFEITAPDSYTGTSLLLRADLNGEKVYPTWTVTSGSQYASVNASGKLTVNTGANNNPVTVQAVYGTLIATKTIYVTKEIDVTISCADTISGTSGNYVVRRDGVDVTETALITVLSGAPSGTSVSAGNITFTASGTVQFYATVSGGYTSPVQTVHLVYSSNSQTETEVSQDGTTTTTTTTTETDPTTGETVTTETVVVTNPDGSESNTNSSTVTNQDGSSSTTSQTTNSDGTSSQTTGTTSAPDPTTGSTTSQSQTVNYDENGDTTGSSTNTTTNNTDGSSSSSTTNYNADGDPTDQTNQDIDSSGNNSTQNVVFDENGDPEVTGYDIDTSENPSGVMEFDGNGVNTEFVPFDGSNKGWICHIKFRSVKTEQPNPPTVEDTEDKGSNYLFNILNMKSPVKPYPGIYLRWALSKKNYSSGNLVFGYTSGGSSSTTQRQITPTTAGLVELNIIYDPDTLIYPSKFRMEQLHNNAAPVSANIEFNSNQIDFTIGYAINQQGQPYRYANLDLYEFSITKLEGY